MVLWVGLARILSLIAGVTLGVGLTSYVVSLKYKQFYPLNSQDFLFEEESDPEYGRRKYCIKKDARGVVLDLETGSGLTAICAAKKADVTKVVAIDDGEMALDVAKQKALWADTWVRHNRVSDKIEFRKGNLFQSVDQNERFDYIILNSPYVTSPTRKVVEEFLREAKNHLNPDGTILALIPVIDRDILSEFEKDYDMKVLEAEDGTSLQRYLYSGLYYGSCFHLYLKKKIPVKSVPVEGAKA
jgi:SAM-dependent methyltransferase